MTVSDLRLEPAAYARRIPGEKVVAAASDNISARHKNRAFARGYSPRHPPQPRFFERSTPNQMWQTDIFTFRLGGKNAYLIGFLNDYSRYVVGLDVFRSQTAEHVLEVYRTAVAEYGVPKEMLSDQGRQYSSWRGTTRFQAELRKDRVHHISSPPAADAVSRDAHMPRRNLSARSIE
jgi:transposase InsO family protein